MQEGLSPIVEREPQSIGKEKIYCQRRCGDSTKGRNKIPRLIWKLGRAERLGKSNDGKDRGAVVKIEKETGTSRCSDRPITS